MTRYKYKFSVVGACAGEGVVPNGKTTMYGVGVRRGAVGCGIGVDITIELVVVFDCAADCGRLPSEATYKARSSVKVDHSGSPSIERLLMVTPITCNACKRDMKLTRRCEAPCACKCR